MIIDIIIMAVHAMRSLLMFLPRFRNNKEPGVIPVLLKRRFTIASRATQLVFTYGIIYLWCEDMMGKLTLQFVNAFLESII
jgi:hypothetical protein